MTLLRRTTVAAVLLALAACSRGGGDVPVLMNARAHQQGPDEFSIVPTQPLQPPPDFQSLPTPTPGGANLVDPDPRAQAAAALGGRAQAVRGDGSVPSADAALVQYAGRTGVDPGIRATLAAEDIEIRRDGGGRVLERLFNTNLYRRAYEDQILDPQAELLRWRGRGVRTPAAPPTN